MTQNIWNTPFSSANGQLLIGSGSGRPSWATLTQGTDCTITNGAGSVTVAFAAPTGGNFTLISSATASSSATISFTGLSSTYDSYVVMISKLAPATDSVILYMRTSTNNGSSYDSGASDYAWNSSGCSINNTWDPEGSTGDSKISLVGDQASEELGNAAGETCAGCVWIYKPSATEYCKIKFDFCYHDITTNIAGVYGGGVRLTAADVDAIQFYMSSGNISTGDFRLYGLTA